MSDNTEMINAQLSALQIQSFETDETGESAENNYPYVIFQLFENKFAVSCKYVVSIEQVAQTTEIVNASREVRGISYYKNEPISVYDLRRLFGIISNSEYINHVADIPGRIADHQMLTMNLIDCAQSGMPFELDTDPQKCDFGKWLHEYKAKTLNLEVRKELEKADPVHDRFHRSAKTMKDFIARGRPDEAAKYSDEIQRFLDDLVRAMNDLNEIMIKTAVELNIILQLKEKKIGLIVDSAESVEDIDEIQALPPSVAMTNYIRKLGLSKKEKQIIFILEAREFNNH